MSKNYILGLLLTITMATSYAYDVNDIISDSTFGLIGYKVSQTLENDKRNHFIAGYVTSYVVTATMRKFKYPQLQSIITGLIAGIGVGISKEIYDSATTGFFDKKDIIATGAGAALAQMRFIIYF